MEQGMDPDIKKYFQKIINSFSLGFLWLFGSITAGIFFRLGYRTERPVIYTITFYVICIAGLAALLRYYYRTWRK